MKRITLLSVILLITSLAIVCVAVSLATRKVYPALDWVSIQGDRFMMGIPSEERSRIEASNYFTDTTRKSLHVEVPQHQVTVKDFEIMKTEVTVSQYRECVKDGGCTAPPNEERCTFYKDDGERMPVNCVDFSDATNFCAWAGGRLPSEAEWEFAARSRGKYLRYPWGDEPAPTCEYAVIDENVRGCGRRSPWPVCSKPKGNTEQGLCDMAGNVWEWTQDYYFDSYEGAPTDGSARATPVPRSQSPETGYEHILRGGGIGSFKDFRNTVKAFHLPEFKYGGLGIRCVRIQAKDLPSTPLHIFSFVSPYMNSDGVRVLALLLAAAAAIGLHIRNRQK